MKVLIACEESQEVCKAFRAKGIEPVKKMDYDGKQYMSVRPIEKEDNDDNERGV